MRVRAALAAVGAWGRPRLAIVACAALAGALVGVPFGTRLYRYQWADARFCDDCHVHDYANEAWARSLHAGLTTCHDCHRVPIRHYPKNAWGALFDRPAGPQDIERPDVPVVVCQQCHSAEGDGEPLTGPMGPEVRALVVRIDDSPLHRVHLESPHRSPTAAHGGGDADREAEGLITCMDCHGAEENRAHRFQSTTAACVGCHRGLGLDEGVAEVPCRTCHGRAFLAPQVPGLSPPVPPSAPR